MQHSKHICFWKDLSRTLKEWRLELNPYGECVATIYIYESQYTIRWTVNNFKISHMDSKVVGGIVDMLNKNYVN